MIISCNQSGKKIDGLKARMDSLQQELAHSYKPGFGEFMSGIQVHHAKLWFAGLNGNWELAGFEIHEIQEALEDIRNFCSDRPETKAIGMINQPLDSLALAIQQKDAVQFKNCFTSLTSTCNRCHRETDHGFNVVTIPTSLPVVNQDFKPFH